MTADGETYYWEYHEDQHHRLTITRPQHIYDAATGAAITVPRYLQRLVRDIWRLHYFRPYTIVWKDWFETRQTTYQLQLQAGLHEYVLPQKFSFLTFYAPSPTACGAPRRRLKRKPLDGNRENAIAAGSP